MASKRDKSDHDMLAPKSIFDKSQPQFIQYRQAITSTRQIVCNLIDIIRLIVNSEEYTVSFHLFIQVTHNFKQVYCYTFIFVIFLSFAT